MAFSSLDESFYKHVLQTYEKNNDVQVLEVKKTLATGKGDNYMSDIYRVFVKYNKYVNDDVKKEEQISFIVKLKPSYTFETHPNILHEVFRNESNMFRNVLPRIENYIGCSMAPFPFYADDDSNFIVMEDLTRRGYNVQERNKGLSLAHCLTAVEKMAKFHAGSVAVAEKEPHLLKSFSSTMFQNFPETYYEFLKISLKLLSKGIAENWKDDAFSKTSEKLENLTAVFKTRILKAFEHDPDEFCVLNHGDFWNNNILFKHNEDGKPCDALMVDFQFVVYSSPAIDLLHFLTMCPELEIKCNKDEYILESYLETLKSTMKQIDCKTSPPKLEELKTAMRKRSAYAVLTGLIYYPRLLSDTTDTETFFEVLQTGDTKMDIFKNPLALQFLNKYIKSIYEKGYLD